MLLIVGLGNPEDKYAGTRHNLGFNILDELRRKLEAGNWSLDKNLKSEIIKTKDQEKQLILARPQTYMNNSGMAVAKIASYFKILPENIAIVHDDLDLSLGHLKIRLGGSAAGHHGVESIISALNSDKFIRLRLGIGNLKTQSAERGGQSINVEKFVLENFIPQEKSTVKRMIKQAVKALETIIEEGVEKAQNQFN